MHVICCVTLSAASVVIRFFFFFQAEDGIRDYKVTGVQTCALPISFHPVLVPVLLVLSTAKFALVVMFYMHLKADSKFFTFLFGAPLLLALGVMVALLFLFFGALTLRGGGAAGAG